jgi:hypothetical protein
MTNPEPVALQEPWTTWRGEVLAVIRVDFRELLTGLQEDDIDWAAWRWLFDAGYPPRIAVDRAFAREHREAP